MLSEPHQTEAKASAGGQWSCLRGWSQHPPPHILRSPGQGPFQGRGQTPLSAWSDLPRATWVQALICTVNRMKEQVKQMLSLSQSLQTARPRPGRFTGYICARPALGQPRKR